MKPRFVTHALGAAGALLAGAGVALSAYAAHAAEAAVRTSLQSAALFALVHGIALAALSRQTPHRFGTLALSMLLVGVLLFSGSLLAAHALGASARLAPVGGVLLILGWLLYAADTLRH